MQTCLGFLTSFFLAFLDWNSLADFMSLVDAFFPIDQLANVSSNLATLFYGERPAGFLVDHFTVFLRPRFASLLFDAGFLGFVNTNRDGFLVAHFPGKFFTGLAGFIFTGLYELHFECGRGVLGFLSFMSEDGSLKFSLSGLYGSLFFSMGRLFFSVGQNRTLVWDMYFSFLGNLQDFCLDLVNFRVSDLLDFVQNRVFEMGVALLFTFFGNLQDGLLSLVCDLNFFLCSWPVFYLCWPVFDLLPDGNFSANFDRSHRADFVQVINADVFFDIGADLPLNGGTNRIRSATFFPID